MTAMSTTAWPQPYVPLQFPVSNVSTGNTSKPDPSQWIVVPISPPNQMSSADTTSIV